MSCFASTNPQFVTRNHQKWEVCDSGIHLNYKIIILSSYFAASKNRTTRQTDEILCSRRFCILLKLKLLASGNRYEDAFNNFFFFFFFAITSILLKYCSVPTLTFFWQAFVNLVCCKHYLKESVKMYPLVARYLQARNCFIVHSQSIYSILERHDTSLLLPLFATSHISRRDEKASTRGYFTRVNEIPRVNRQLKKIMLERQGKTPRQRNWTAVRVVANGARAIWRNTRFLLYSTARPAAHWTGQTKRKKKDPPPVLLRLETRDESSKVERKGKEKRAFKSQRKRLENERNWWITPLLQNFIHSSWMERKTCVIGKERRRNGREEAHFGSIPISIPLSNPHQKPVFPRKALNLLLVRKKALFSFLSFPNNQHKTRFFFFLLSSYRPRNKLGTKTEYALRRCGLL